MPATLLIADGERELFSLMEAALTEDGFQVITTNSGHGVLSLARQEKPDLIILDWMLPDVDGYEFIRRRQQREETPVIMLSAAAGIDDRVLCLELGADDFVTKPFGLEEFSLCVRAVLRRAGRTTRQTRGSRINKTVPGLDCSLALT